MAEHGDDIDVPLKPPSKQVRSGDATQSSGGACPLFARGNTHSNDEYTNNKANNDSCKPAGAGSPYTPAMNSVPTSAVHSALPAPAPARDVVVTDAGSGGSLPPSALPGSAMVAMNSMYSPSENPGSYTINLDNINVSSPVEGEDGDVNGVPVRLSTRRSGQLHPWHYNIFMLCQEMNSCLESFFCVSCQTGRQCNMVLNNQRGIHWPVCLLSFCFGGSMYSMGIIQGLLMGQLRQMVRKRYGVSGSLVSDFCTGFCCTSCALQQMLLEMTVMDEFPGATCYEANAAAPPVVVEMV